MTLADQIRTEVRKSLRDAGITQREAARRLRVSERHVSFMLNGKTGLSPYWAEKLAGLCGVELTIVSRRSGS